MKKTIFTGDSNASFIVLFFFFSAAFGGPKRGSPLHQRRNYVRPDFIPFTYDTSHKARDGAKGNRAQIARIGVESVDRVVGR